MNHNKFKKYFLLCSLCYR